MSSFLKKPFVLGGLTLPSNIFYAPLAGCSDYPFRQMSAQYHPGLMFCEMVKMDPLVRRDEGTLKMLDYQASMRPIGAQICGSKAHLAAPAAKIVEEMGFDVIDLNCGCPVDKVTKDGSGSGLLKTPQLIGDILSNMVSTVKIPVTLKIRAGWDEQQIIAPTVTRIAAEAGAAAICIHGRTREQSYRGPANWDWIAECVEIAKKHNLIVIGNGDVFTAEAASKMFQKTGCDAVLVSRGTMGQPWIAQEIEAYLSSQPLPVRTHLDRCVALGAHFEKILRYYPERKALLDMRRVSCWYIKNAFKARAFRDLINKATSVKQVQLYLQELMHMAQEEPLEVATTL